MSAKVKSVSAERAVPAVMLWDVGPDLTQPAEHEVPPCGPEELTRCAWGWERQKGRSRRCGRTELWRRLGPEEANVN